MKNPHDHQRYAVKELTNLTNEDGSTNHEAMYELIDEVRKMGTVSSPFIVRYHTSAVFDGRFYIMMDVIEGAEFRDVVVARQAEGVHFPDALLVAWIDQLAKGLAHLHDECKLVHQDLHNGNVMITGVKKGCNGTLATSDASLRGTGVKILDLGLAAFKSDSEHRTATCTMRTSTMRTMRAEASKERRGSFILVNADEVGGFKAIRAPEMHAAGQGGLVRFNSKTDVWALGILLVEAALLRPIEA